MLRKLLAGGDFAQWASFVSPAFFEVMPAQPLWRRFKDLAAGSRDRVAYQQALTERREQLRRCALPIALEDPAELRPVAPGGSAPPAPNPPEASAAQARARHLVELYFHQLFHGATSLLDLRKQAFSPELPSRWRPAAWVVQWDAGFLLALRQLYAGFYREDADQFRAGLTALHLTSAEHVFRHHFGAGQREVTFRVRDFVATFHQVFSTCKEARVQLHPDFLPLGLYLATLYDHLEQLSAPVDVFAAFHTAAPRQH
jgi:hypothetical protein